MQAEPTTETNLVRALVRATRAVTTHLEPTLRDAGLTLDQWLAIDALHQAGGLTMSELATATAVTGPTLTRVVDRLVMTAVVFREVDAADRRKVRVYLAPRGRTTHRKLSPKLAAAERDLLAAAGAPPSLTHLLAKITTA
ncbi:MarR family winged helix-turn-helix transcriptional regulator [Pseudonocardia spinosispora]|uniref:MarR family winged helix-turn-helix transcriptional regulator n=1 Tax=Pseudonocardia spinosispora TaxID=103441 RepID=UPI0003FD8E39|nr:MarR family transcriptional regulator [Pseudonocardia spinosispora]